MGYTFHFENNLKLYPILPSLSLPCSYYPHLYLFSSLLLQPCNLSWVSMAITRRRAERPKRLGVGVEQMTQRRAVSHTSEQKCSLCVYEVCVYIVCALCYFVCIWGTCTHTHTHTHTHTADKALIGWSEIHHGNCARELCMSSVHRSRHTQNRSEVCDPVKIQDSRPTNRCSVLTAGCSQSVLSDSGVHRRS